MRVWMRVGWEIRVEVRMKVASRGGGGGVVGGEGGSRVRLGDVGRVGVWKGWGVG